jgi:hypothetical protein
LSETQTEFIQQFILNGGQVIILDAFPELPFSNSWTTFLGGTWNQNPLKCEYGVAEKSMSEKLPSVILLNNDMRQVVPPAEAEIWYSGSPTPGGSFIPETYQKLEKGDNPLLFNLKKGKGEVTYFASGFGNILWTNDLPDYAEILVSMLYQDQGNDWMIITDAPRTVNLTAYKVNSDLVLHLVNGTGMIPLEEPVTTGPVKLTIKNISPGKISFLEPGGETVELKGQTRGNNLEITIDRLDAYGMLIIHTK